MAHRVGIVSDENTDWGTHLEWYNPAAPGLSIQHLKCFSVESPSLQDKACAMGMCQRTKAVVLEFEELGSAFLSLYVRLIHSRFDILHARTTQDERRSPFVPWSTAEQLACLLPNV
jgi:hypothetical protein